jgi:hypothetical protein
MSVVGCVHFPPVGGVVPVLRGAADGVVVDVDRAGPRALTNGVLERDVGAEEQPELDDSHDQEQDGEQDEGELDQGLATHRTPGPWQGRARPPE